MPNYIGLDVGGTKIEGILVTDKLRVLRRVRRPTEADKDQRRIVENIVKVVKELNPNKAEGIGIGAPGFTDSKGCIQVTPNIKAFDNFPLKKTLERKLKKKIHLENDAHCFVLAEQRAGCAKGLQNVIGLTLGTGVGGGAVVDGRLLQGKSGGATHFGHMIVDRQALFGKGTAEDWLGGRNIELRYKTRTSKYLSAKKILQSNNKEAGKITQELYQNLGITAANLISAFNPEAIVLGGSVADSVNIKQLQTHVKKYGEPALIKETKILRNKLGGTAGAYGAALLAMG